MSWLAGWDKRIKLTIDNGDIDDALEDFPILVYLSDSSGRTATDVSCVFDELTLDANRKKIAVTLSDGITQCYVEIEQWDDGNEKAWLWVKVPDIASGTDTELYLYYDAKKADNDSYVGDTNSTPAENVWDANFKAVYHMANGVDAGHIYDSTDNNIDGTKKGGNEPNEVSGQIGKAQDYDGANDFIDLGTSSVIRPTDKVTIEILAYIDPASPVLDGGIAHIYSQTVGGIDGAILFWDDRPGQTTNGIRWVIRGQGNISLADKNNAIAAAAYYYLAGTYNKDEGGAEEMKNYINAVKEATADFSYAMEQPVENTAIGASYSHAGSEYFNDKICEVRVSDIDRTPAWIKATKESLFDGLLAFGAEEDVPLEFAYWGFATWA